MKYTSPFVTFRNILPSRGSKQSGISLSSRIERYAYRKDWPQRKVVLIHSSLKLMGNLRHSEKAPTVMMLENGRDMEIGTTRGTAIEALIGDKVS
jgi:hypothetical protein